ncbi:MAG: phosphotransferase [Pseudomonadales bacterium]
MSSDESKPRSLSDISAEYLTAAFLDAGILRHGRVIGFDSRVIGEGAGFMGEVVDLHATFSSDSDAGSSSQSVIMKIPTATKNRQIGQTLGVYEREIRFYRELQPILGIRTPKHFYSAMDATTEPETGLKALKLMDSLPIWMIRMLLPFGNWINRNSNWHYILMIEHLGHFRIGDQVSGCSFDESRRVLETMAQMHSQFWQSQKLSEFKWLVPIRYIAKPTHMLFLRAIDQFKRQHAETLTAHTIDLIDWLESNYLTMMKALANRPSTLIHGDFRLDNLCFDDHTGDVVLFDWQTLGVGAGGIDLAYFLSAAVGVNVSSGRTDELIEYYRGELAKRGVHISRDALQWDYDVSLLILLHRLVPAQFQDFLELGEGRGTDLLDTWLERILVHVERVNPPALLANVPRS